jgi:hypothetical protein
MFMAVKRATRRTVRKASSSASKLPARIERSAKGAVTKARRNHSSTVHFGKLIATAGLLIAAAASAAVFVPRPMLRDAKDKLGKNLLPLGHRVAELASRLAEDAENFGK